VSSASSPVVALEGDLKLDDINTLQNNLRNEIGKAQASGKNLNEHFGKLK